jgi:CHAT domain-containing protein
LQALENRRMLYTGDMEELYWNEMGLLMDQSLLTGDPEPLMIAIQRWKATSLRDAIAQRLEPSMQPTDMSAIWETSPVNQTILDVLDSGEASPTFEEEAFWNMAEIAEVHLGDEQRVIFVDWTRYYDTLFMVAYDGTGGRIKKCVVEFDYQKIEQWVHRELGVTSLQQGRIDRKRLRQVERLNELTPILEGLESFIMPGDLLILCPSGILHAVPLHAIPFKGKPLIASNPVVFCPSFSLLQTCVKNVQDSTSQSTIPAAAFTRLGPDDPVEESRMFATAREGLSDALLQTTFVSGRDLTRDAFLGKTRGVRLLHYHGHAFLEPARRRDRALQLEPRPATADSLADNGLLSVIDIFDLQLDSAVVVLLACASGEDDVAPNDDPLGLLSAFLYAGAGSIVATRWPTQTSDAREFAKRFYAEAFSNRKNGIVNLATAFQAAVLSMWEDWDEDDPYHWAQFQLCECYGVCLLWRQHGAKF